MEKNMGKQIYKPKKLSRKIYTSLFIGFLLGNILYVSPSLALTVTPGRIYESSAHFEYRNITVYAPAVGRTQNGYVGVISTITVTIQSNGSGQVFVDTLPLTQIDMQGSARLAVKVASSLVASDKNSNINPYEYDYFFVIRTSSPVIGGPSAGGIMTAAVVSLLEGWTMDNRTVMTGMINPDGSIGPVGGITKKIDAAYSVGAKRFLVPEGQMVYTDTVTETTTKNGWIQTITRTVTRNVSDYAMTHYGIEVKEVSDINDVLLYYTGHIFPVTPSEHSISTQDYISSMEPLATSLLNEANQSYHNASEAFDQSSIPNYFPNYYRNQVTDFLNNAEKLLQEAKDWYKKQLYYTSTTQSFSSLIMSRFVNYACEYFNTDDKQGYVDRLLSEAKSLYKNESSIAKQAQVKGAISLQCVGAAQTRATEAQEYISSAEAHHQKGDDFTALYEIAFAMERSRSIGWWLGLTKYFNDTGTITSEQLKNLANDYIDDAQQSIIYSTVILQEMGTSSQLLSEANNLLDSARTDNDNGYPAAALFEALKALAKGNLALELVDANSKGKIQSKIARANESASASIRDSRLRGIEPVLAVSYYELAQSYIDDDVETALFYYKYSSLITGVLTYSGTPKAQTSSRYLGIPAIHTPASKNSLTNQGLIVS
ncbi:MAG TPA: hypothetical protein ENI44_02980, partial [Thermoplasmatales archaeon]|nr:hypothetical protein [Thermoplasmatales archaeon]